MDITSRRRKYGKKQSNDTKTGGYIIPFDLEMLTLFGSFILSSNENIRKSSYINMRNLFSVMDPEGSFGKDESRLRRYNFIRRGLDARVIERLDDPYLIKKYINGSAVAEDVLAPENFREVGNEEIVYINETISSCIKNSYVNEEIDEIEELCSEWRTLEFRQRAALLMKFEDIISRMQNKFRKVKVERDATDMVFSLRNSVFDSTVRQVHADMSRPSNKLLTGMQGFNEMLSGGFESARVYALFGLPGEGKTTTLLNLACQIKKYNKNYKTKDPTKTPCIVFLTQENSIKESTNSIFNITVNPADINNYDVDEVIRMMREEGGLCLTDDSPIDIFMTYKPVNSIDTSYLYELTEDLEDDGYEVICVIQDYIKRIRPVDRTGDPRIDYGNVINDFKTFATIKNIPVITASQLNREATKHIDEGRKMNKSDLVRLLGRSNIGESMLILENLDAGFMIAPERDKDNLKFLGIQRIKARYKKISERESIYQPFLEDNPIALVCDQDDTLPSFKDSLRFDGVAMNVVGTNAPSYRPNQIKEIDDNISLLHSDDTNIFINSGKVFDENSMPQAAYHSYELVNPIQKVNFSPVSSNGLINVLVKTRTE